MIFHILLQRLHKGFWLPATLSCKVHCLFLKLYTHSWLSYLKLQEKQDVRLAFVKTWPFDETLKVFAGEHKIIRNKTFKKGLY